MIILAGDIGGTKTNIALYKYTNNTLEEVVKEQFSSQSFDTFQEILNTFITKHSIATLDAICLGIAGPIINDECKTTNLPWIINKKDLQKEFHLEHVYLLNDLASTAYGMHLDDNEFIELNPNHIETTANRAVIAAGTGLGEGILYFDGDNFHPIASEGGHTDFAALNELQDKLLVWLRKTFQEHVSVERIISGVGISTLYDFLLETQEFEECDELKNLSTKIDKNALISKLALEKNDPLCVATLDLFCEIYGAEAGNLALKSLALGGVYIGGGIAPKILPFMKNGKFLKSFVQKGRFQSMLENISLKLSLNQETSLLGAVYYAVDKLKN